MATATTFNTTRKLAPWFAAAAMVCMAAGAQAQQGNQQQAAQPSAAQQAQIQQVASAVVQRFQGFLIAFNGNGAMAPDSLSPSLTQQISPAQLQQMLAGLRSNVGPCQAIGRMQTTDAANAGFLLNCEKGYMPVNLTIDGQPPYRVNGLLIQPTFWK